MAAIDRQRRSGLVRCCVVGLATVIAGCGSGASGHSSATTPGPSTSATTGSVTTDTSASTTTSSTSTSTKPRRRHRREPAGAPVGATQHLHADGASLNVTVTAVLDPLKGSGANLPSGTRAVAVQVRIADLAGATYDSTASGDWSLRVSSAVGATPLEIKQGVCATQLVDFESLVGSGDVRTGCVGFAVPSHARVTAVLFSAHSDAAKSVSWRS